MKECMVEIETQMESTNVCTSSGEEEGGMNWGVGTDISSGEGHGNSFQYACLENPVDRSAWRAIVHRVSKSWTGLKQCGMRASP